MVMCRLHPISCNICRPSIIFLIYLTNPVFGDCSHLLVNFIENFHYMITPISNKLLFFPRLYTKVITCLSHIFYTSERKEQKYHKHEQIVKLNIYLFLSYIRWCMQKNKRSVGPMQTLKNISAFWNIVNVGVICNNTPRNWKHPDHYRKKNLKTKKN